MGALIAVAIVGVFIVFIMVGIVASKRRHRGLHRNRGATGGLWPFYPTDSGSDQPGSSEGHHHHHHHNQDGSQSHHGHHHDGGTSAGGHSHGSGFDGGGHSGGFDGGGGGHGH